MKNTVMLLILGIALILPLSATFLIYLLGISLITLAFYHTIFGGLFIVLALLRMLKIYLNNKIKELDD